MDFTITETEQQLVAGIRDLCARFPDEYWLEHDDSKVFPWEFYEAFAAGGWLGIAIPEEYGGGGLGVSAASLVLKEVAASGAGMNGCSSVHIGVFGLDPLIKHGSERPEEGVPPAHGRGRPARLVRGHGARRRHRHHAHLDVRHPRGRRLPDLGQEGVDHQGAGGRAHADPGAHQPP